MGHVVQKKTVEIETQNRGTIYGPWPFCFGLNWERKPTPIPLVLMNLLYCLVALVLSFSFFGEN